MPTQYDAYTNRRPLKLHLLIELLQPLSHISETTGNEAALNVMPITDLEGNIGFNPIYSANAQRNGNMGRRSAISSFFDALDIAVNQATHQTLYSGGYIEGTTGNDLDWEANARQIPALSVLGAAVPKGVMGAKNSQMMPGRIAIGDAYLICYESIKYIYEMFPPAVPEPCLEGVSAIAQAMTTFQEARVMAHLCPKAERPERIAKLEEARRQLEAVRLQWLPFLQDELQTATEWMNYKQTVRVPSLKQSELKRHLLSGDKPLLIDEEPTDDGKDKKKAKPKKEAGRQMIAGSWVLRPGAQLYSFWAAQGQGITPQEEGAIVDALLKFAETPYIGGKSATGCGLVKLNFWYQSGDEFGHYLSVSPGNQQTLSPRADEVHHRYREVLDDYRDRIAQIKAGETPADAHTLQSLIGGGEKSKK